MKKQNWDISFDMHVSKYREIDPAEASQRTNLEFETEQSRFRLSTLGYVLRRMAGI